MRSVALLVLAACVPTTPSGDVFAPARVAPAPAAPGAPRASANGQQGDFDFEGEDRTEGEDAQEDVDPLELQARMLGVPLEAVERPVPRPVAPAPTAVAPMAPPAPVWDPSYPLPDASFGVRVLAVLLDLQPPRAVLGLPDGREQVVTPGAMLPVEGLVVLAIGRDAVQLAKVTPAGFYARVETQTVRALYPQSAP